LSLKELTNEVGFWFLLSIITVFLLINFNPVIGQVYIAMMVMGGVALVYFVVSGRTPFYSRNFIKKSNNWLTTIFLVAVAVIAFQVISSFAFGAFNISSQNVFKNVQASAPVFSDNPILQFFTFGGLIPNIETLTFFVLLLDVVALTFIGSGNLQLFNINTYVLIILISAAFTIFHLTSKSGLGQAYFVQTFIFAAISIILVLYTGQALEAVLFHTVVNSWASINLLKTIDTAALMSSSIIYFIGGGVLIYFLNKKKVLSGG
jgi:hypothetical protein